MIMIRAGEFSDFDGRLGLARHRLVIGTSALLFFASVATAIYFCQSMSGGMAITRIGSCAIWRTLNPLGIHRFQRFLPQRHTSSSRSAAPITGTSLNSTT